MKDLLIACLLILVIYLYKSFYDLDYKVNYLMIENQKLKDKQAKIESEIGFNKVRSVNWFSQFEEQILLKKKTNKIITNEGE